MNEEVSEANKPISWLLWYVKFEQIPRENNSATDEVARLASSKDAAD